MIKNILFDMDGTLLPMDQDEFTDTYMNILAGTFYSLGYEPKKLCKTVWDSFVVMLRNNSDKTNEQVFFEEFKKVYGDETEKLHPLFDSFYCNEFQAVKKVCGKDENAIRAVQIFKKAGFNLIVATLPAFPREAIYSRIRWAGLSPDDFSYITTYENSRRSKPSPLYYTEITEKLSLDPRECLMVGNNVDEDMIAESIGMKCFLVPSCLINEKNKDISVYPKGDFNDLIEYVKNIAPDHFS